MPIYEYACESCGHRFEKLVRMGASEPPCPECEQESVRKLISQSGFILKGGGWYKDHYGLKSSGKASASESGAASSSASAESSSASAESSSSDSSGAKKDSSPSSKSSDSSGSSGSSGTSSSSGGSSGASAAK